MRGRSESGDALGNGDAERDGPKDSTGRTRECNISNDTKEEVHWTRTTPRRKRAPRPRGRTKTRWRREGEACSKGARGSYAAAMLGREERGAGPRGGAQRATRRN